MSSAPQIYKRNPDFIARKIAGEIVLIPLQKKIYDIHSIYNLNELACQVWERLDGNRTVQSIQSELLDLYEVEEKVLNEDLNVLITQLEEVKAILPNAQTV